jgi:DNA modification methylase
VAFVLKGDFETRDDVQLAELEIEGLCDERPVRFSDGKESLGAWSDLIESVTRAGVSPDRILLGSAPPDALEVLRKRLGMSDAVLLADGSNIREAEMVQRHFELLAGASGAGNGTGHRSRKKNEYLTHPFHKYKAKFFPRLARALLNFTTGPGERALDPFVGSGTLNVEAALMGVESVGVDIDPLSVFIAQTKIDGLTAPTDQLEQAIAELRAHSNLPPGRANGFELHRTDPQYRLPDFLGSKIASGREDIEWEVSSLRPLIEGVANPPAKALLRLALSHALATKISLRWMGTGDNRFALSVAKRGIAPIMDAHLRRMLKGLAQRDELVAAGLLDVDELAPAKLLRGDVRDLGLEDDSFGGIVTSPPYLPASSGRETYLRSRAPSLVALNFLSEAEILQQDQLMVGSILRRLNGHQTVLPREIEDLVAWMRPQRARAPKAEPTAVYFHDLAESLREMGRVLKPSGRVAMVVSNEHIFYDLITRETVRTLSMPDTIAELIAEPRNEIPLKIDRVIRIELPKMDYAARPASRGPYSEAIVIASGA